MILLDTHAFVWLASDPDRLTPAARSALQVHGDTLHVSVVSAWEVSLLVRRGRLSLPLSPEEFVRRAIEHHALIELPLERETAQASVALLPLHNDPFDRILIAECHRRGLTLVSADRQIPSYPNLRVIW